MSTIVARLPQGRFSNMSSRLGLSAMFLIFCYTLLSWRAVLLSDAAPIISERRFFALLVGAGFFWLTLKRLDTNERITLARAASWIVAATALVLSARVLLGWLMPAVPLTLSYEVRWSLAWGAYFGLWVMGAITFRRRPARHLAANQADTIAEATRARPASHALADDLEWMVEAMSPELASLEPTARDQLAERLLAKAGRYELADERDPWSAAHNRRLQLATRIADRIRAR